MIEHSNSYRRDWAYWREVLRDASSIVPIAGRRRAAAPTGMGRNRGVMGFLHARLEGVETADPAKLMAAYVSTLKEMYCVDALVVDNWFSERGSSQPANMLGPLDSFYPVVLPATRRAAKDLLPQIKHTVAQAHSHRSIDTPTLERELGEWLRARKISLRQFGFAYIDAEQAEILSPLDTPLDAVAKTPHEIQLVVAVSKTGLLIRLGVDLDVVSEEETKRLLDQTLIGIKTMLDLSAAPEPQDRCWSVREWPEHVSIVAEPDEEAEPIGIANVQREIPITSSQLGILRFIDHPKATPLAKAVWSMGKDFIVRPRMDIARLKRASEALIERHEVLRTRFVKQGDRYRAYLEADPSPLLRIETVSNEVAARERAAELAQEIIDVTDPLFRITLIRFGDAGDMFVARAHHIVMDSYTLGLVVEDVVKAYLGIPMPAVEMDIDRFVEAFDHTGKPGSFNQREAFLRELFADPPPIPNVGRKAKGMQPNACSVDCGLMDSISIVLSSDLRDAMSMRAKAAGTTEAAMVSAAYADTLATKGGVEEVILNMPYARRESRQLENYANFVATPLPVRVRPSSHSTLEDIAVAISGGIEAAIPFAPFSDAFYGSALQEEVVSKGSYMSLYHAGEVTAGARAQDSVSAPLQRPDAIGEIDMGAMTLEILPDMRLKAPAHFELGLRTFRSGESLGIRLAYDRVGFEPDEAEQFIDEVIARLERS